MGLFAKVRAACAGGVVGLLLTPTLRAETTAIAVRYSAPVECPGEREFLLEARRRHPRIADGPTLEEPRLFVTIWKSESPLYAGKLELATASGTVGVREISGSTCAEVSAALALITALTADLAPASRDAGSPGVTSSENVVSPAPSERASIESSLGPSDEAPGGVPWLRWQFGAGGTFASGVTPHPFLAGTVFVQAGVRTSSIWAPSVRVAGSFGGSSWSPDPPGGSADGEFTWAAGSLEGCPLQLGDPRSLSLTPCVRVAIGALDVSSSGRATGPQHETRPWVDVGAVLRGRWQLGRALFVELDGGPFVPSPRYEFRFDDSYHSYVDPMIGLRLGAGVGLALR